MIVYDNNNIDDSDDDDVDEEEEEEEASDDDGCGDEDIIVKWNIASIAKKTTGSNNTKKTYPEARASVGMVLTRYTPALEKINNFLFAIIGSVRSHVPDRYWWYLLSYIMLKMILILSLDISSI